MPRAGTAPDYRHSAGSTQPTPPREGIEVPATGGVRPVTDPGRRSRERPTLPSHGRRRTRTYSRAGPGSPGAAPRSTRTEGRDPRRDGRVDRTRTAVGWDARR